MMDDGCHGSDNKKRLPMNGTPGSRLFPIPRRTAEELLRRYTVLLELYTELESVSDAVFAALENGSPPHVIRGRLEAKKDIADRIVTASREIAGLKQKIATGGGIGDDLRSRIRRCDEELTRVVNRVVAFEDRSRDLIMSRGMKISRR
jgi:hypothetical protein